MSFSLLEPKGLSNLVEAATALATFSARSSPPLMAEDFTNNANTSSSIGPSLVLDTNTYSPENGATGIASAAANKELFPERLMTILNDESVCRDVISWLPNGRSFIITRPDIFMESVLPLYIAPTQQPKTSRVVSTKYPSFTRKLNRWGFRQITRGPETGAFHHPLFRRDMPELCLEMVCQRSRSTSKTDQVSTGASTTKKRRVSVLTKESLEAMNQQQATEFKMAPCLHTVETQAVTVSEDSHSLRSSFSGASPPASDAGTTPTSSLQKSPLLGGNVTNDAKLVRRAITRRNEEERMRVAKVMLYNSFLQAMNGEDV